MPSLILVTRNSFTFLSLTTYVKDFMKFRENRDVVNYQMKISEILHFE
jgi:hypothetical protein